MAKALITKNGSSSRGMVLEIVKENKNHSITVAVAPNKYATYQAGQYQRMVTA